PASNFPIGIRKTRRSVVSASTAPRIGPTLILSRDPRYVRVAEGVRRPNRGLAVPFRIPSNSAAGVKVRPLPVGARFPGETWITWEVETEGGVYENRAPRACTL